jgi:glutaredoxin 3
MSIVVHSKTGCKYCDMTQDLLFSKNVSFVEIIYNPDEPDYDQRRDELVARTKMRTFPQIFVGDVFVGGYSDLMIADATTKMVELCAKIGVDWPMDF